MIPVVITVSVTAVTGAFVYRIVHAEKARFRCALRDHMSFEVVIEGSAIILGVLHQSDTDEVASKEKVEQIEQIVRSTFLDTFKSYSEKKRIISQMPEGGTVTEDDVTVECSVGSEAFFSLMNALKSRPQVTSDMQLMFDNQTRVIQGSSAAIQRTMTDLFRSFEGRIGDPLLRTVYQPVLKDTEAMRYPYLIDRS